MKTTQKCSQQHVIAFICVSDHILVQTTGNFYCQPPSVIYKLTLEWLHASFATGHFTCHAHHLLSHIIRKSMFGSESKQGHRIFSTFEFHSTAITCPSDLHTRCMYLMKMMILAELTCTWPKYMQCNCLCML